MHQNPRVLCQGVFLLLLSLVFIFIFLSITLETTQHFKWPLHSILDLSSKPITFLNLSNNTEDEQTSLDSYSIWCLNMAHRLDTESLLPHSPILRAPLLNSSKLNRLPYRYSQWQSSPRLARGFTPCEHNLAMRLLMIVERICRKHHITFMLSDGSLLGSWRHHDIIPWDDDLDIMIPNEQRELFISLMEKMNETLVKYDTFSYGGKEREYYKISFKNTASAGSYQWNFPFLDIFVYWTNQTHLWRMIDPDTMIKIEYVFPLLMRPFGELWLPAPRKPQKLFPFDIYDQCQGPSYSHRKETTRDGITVKCADLKDIYPFVHRNDQSNSREILKINEKIIHTIV